MRRYLPLLLIALASAPSAFAQQQDTMLMVYLKEINVTDARKWTNDTARYRFNQMRYYVQTILPYVQEATKTFGDINAHVNNPGVSRKEKKKYVQEREELLRNDFEPKVKALNETQGVLLIKLIARQTGANIYSILTEFKNPFTAIKWQGWARLNGFNLNKRYTPEEEPLLEQVMLSLGYDLPAFYEKPLAAGRQ